MKKIFLLLSFIFLLTSLSTVFADEKEDSKALFEQGDAKFKAGNTDGAIADLEKAIALDQRNFRALKLLVEALDSKGKALVNAEDFEGALEIYKKAYKLWPDNADIKEMYRRLRDRSSATPNVEEQKEKKNVEFYAKLEEAQKRIDEIKETKVVDTVRSSGTEDPAEKLKTKMLQEELAKQKELIEKMKENYESASKIPGDFSSEKREKDQEIINSLLGMYKDMLEQEKRQEAAKGDFYAEQMKAYREMVQSQSKETRSIILVVILSLFGVVFIVFFLFFFLVRMSQKRRFQPGGYADFGYAYNMPPNQVLEGSQQSFLLGYEGARPASFEQDVEQAAGNLDNEMYNDLLKVNKLKELHEQMRSGNLRWQTVREYIGELDKELRSEILNTVEIKLQTEQVIDYTAALQVLFPFLTDGDDFMRKKAEVLAKKVMEKQENDGQEPDVALLEDKQETGKKKKKSKKEDIGDINVIMKYVNELDKETGRKEHCLNVAKYAKGIGMMLKFKKHDLDILYKTGLVHDFGYLLMDPELLRAMRDNRELSDEEKNALTEHPKKGVEFFKDFKVELEQDMLDGILHHHERKDGSGYPNGLKGADIPEFGMIIAIADTFDAMTSKRSYKDTLSFDSAAIILKDLGKSKYEARHIDALIEYVKRSKD